MTEKKTPVFGISHDAAQTGQVVDRLMDAGFSGDDISVLLPDNSSNDLAPDQKTQADRTTTRVTGGGMISGTLGLLGGIEALAIPGLGPCIAAGPMIDALARLGVDGAVGGSSGALVGMGIPAYEAKRYEGRIKEGGVLLSVYCDSSEEITDATVLLRQAGAQDISSTAGIGADKPLIATLCSALNECGRPSNSRETYDGKNFCE